MRRPPDTPPPDTRTAALRLLTRRDYTTSELAEKLRARGCDAGDIDRVLADLTRAGLLDDRRVAAAFVRTASRIKGRGRLRIARELEAKGVDKVTVRDVVANLSPESESDAIAAVLARMRTPAPQDAAARRRLFQRLMRRGFSYEAIAKTLKSRPDEE